MIIGICGLIGSGKGTVADILVDYHDFQKISFADKLKDGVAQVFGWDRAMLEGDTDRSRLWREKVDEYWTKETGREITPRLVLQEFGTDCMRMGFYDGIWVSLVKKHMLDNPHVNYVIPDVRFPNEMSMIRELDGEVWQVRRGEQPDWWQFAVLDNNTDSRFMDEYKHVHTSEWKWVDSNDKFEHILYNDSTLEALYSQVEQTLST
jgi:hypothetical protein